MTQSEKVFLEAKERAVADKNIVITEDFILEVIQDLYSHLDIMQQAALLESIHISSLIEDVREELKEKESYNHSPLEHVGMKVGDFV